MKTNLKFVFNGVTSDEMGLYNVHINKPTSSQIIGAARSLTKTKSINSSANVITKTELEPLTFSLRFTLLDGSFTSEKIRQIYEYFDVDDYSPLSFSNNPDFYYNVMPFQNQSEINLFNENKGYFEINFICDAGHGWIDREYNFKYSQVGYFDIDNETNVKVNGSYLVYPFMRIELLNDCDYFSIRLSTSDENNWFTLRNLNVGDTIEIDNKNGIITSKSGDNIYRKMDTFDFFYLEKGNNIIYRREQINNITQAFNLKVNCSYPVIE